VEHDRTTSRRRQGEAEVPPTYPTIMDIANERNLMDSLRRLRRKGDTSPGVDGVMIDHIYEDLRWLKDLAKKVRRGTYNPQPVIERRIPKLGRPGRYRLIGIPIVVDRMVSKTISSLLQPSFELGFEDCSWGYRLGRNAVDCACRIRQALNLALSSGRETHIIKTDIAQLFDSLHLGILLRLLRTTVPDKRIRRLIRKFLRAGRIIEGRPVRSGTGTV
jgi:RNA-directed DNA polymerase